MKKDIPIVLKDSKTILNIVIQADLKKNATTVFSGFSPWENLALILEGLGVTVEKCLQEGMSKKKVYGAVKDYMTKVLTSYEIKED